nr:MAG TPA: hypothetical protein [Caudoviricetes sp.]
MHAAETASPAKRHLLGSSGGRVGGPGAAFSPDELITL